MMRDVMNEIEKAFAQAEWDYERSQEYPNEFHTGFTGENAKWTCRGFIEDGVFVFLVMFANYVPVDKRSVLADLVCRLNNLFYIGNFQFDFISGGMMFRVSSPVIAEECFTSLIQDLIRTGVLVADDCYPAVMKVIYSDVRPEQVIKELCTNEGDTEVITQADPDSELTKLN